ncbi:unnamed protein product, partial [marine sediment metagenome]
QIQQDYIKDLLALGKKAYQVKWFDDAKRIFEEVLKVDKDNKIAKEWFKKIDIEKLITLGEERYNLKKYKDAKESFEEVIKIDKDNKKAKEFLKRINKKPGVQKKEDWISILEKGKAGDWNRITGTGSLSLKEKELYLDTTASRSSIFMNKKEKFKNEYSISYKIKTEEEDENAVGQLVFGIAFGMKANCDGYDIWWFIRGGAGIYSPDTKIKVYSTRRNNSQL